MPKAIWNNVVLAETDAIQKVENNVYFPPDSINKEFLKDSATRTVCHWKGKANYFNIEVEGNINKDAAWTYLSTKDRAKNIEGHIAFWKGVKIEM